MATFNTNSPTTVGLPLGNQLTAFFATLITTFNNWNDARASRKALGALPDFLLNDIGLTRGDVDQIIR